jgi:hypothetical protein
MLSGCVFRTHQENMVDVSFVSIMNRTNAPDLLRHQLSFNIHHCATWQDQTEHIAAVFAKAVAIHRDLQSGLRNPTTCCAQLIVLSGESADSFIGVLTWIIVLSAWPQSSCVVTLPSSLTTFKTTFCFSAPSSSPPLPIAFPPPRSCKCNRNILPSVARRPWHFSPFSPQRNTVSQSIERGHCSGGGKIG